MAGSYLKKRGATYYTNKRVPDHLRRAADRTHIVQSTGTGDRRLAEQRALKIIGDELHRLEQLAALQGTPTAEPAWLRGVAEQLRQARQSGDLDPEHASELMSLARERHLKEAGVRVDRNGHPVISESHLQSIRLAHTIAARDDFTPLSHATEQYLTEKKRTVTASTAYSIERTLDEFKDWLDADLEVAAITRQHAGAFTSHLLETGRAFATNKKAVGMLVTFWNWCIRKGYYEKANPWEGQVQDLKGSKRGSATASRTRRPWLPEEIEAFAKALPASDQRWQVFALALYSGMRREEILSTKVSEVNLADGYIALPEGKTQSSVRQVPIHPVVRPLVEYLSAISTDGYLLSGLSRSGKDKRRGHGLGNSFRYALRKLAGIEDPGVVLHSLRNTFIKACEDRLIPTNIAESIVGHRRQSLSYGLYSPGADLAVLKENAAKVSFGSVDDLVREKLAGLSDTLARPSSASVTRR